MWVLKFVGGLIAGWVFLGLILNKDFWKFLFHLIFGMKGRVAEEPLEDEEPEPPQVIQPTIQPVKFTQPAQEDLSKMPREELAELLRNSEVRVKKT